jgi:hypothetical protein
MQHGIHGEWLVCSDFNNIYKAEDKSNSRLSKRLMGRFKAILDNPELRALPLHGRRFTWTSSCSAQAVATMKKIDRVFCSTSWEELFPTTHIHAWASTCSYHCPLILQGNTSPRKYKGFRFESYWLKIPGFLDVVKQAWNKPM